MGRYLHMEKGLLPIPIGGVNLKKDIIRVWVHAVQSETDSHLQIDH